MEHTFAAAAAVLLITAAATAGLFALSGSFENPKETFSPETEVSCLPPEKEKMTLGVFEGKLALFIGESPYPNMIYDFLIRTLPGEDQQRLSEGIEISSEEELYALLEDYMS